MGVGGLIKLKEVLAHTESVKFIYLGHQCDLTLAPGVDTFMNSCFLFLCVGFGITAFTVSRLAMVNLYFDKKKGMANAIQAVAYSVGSMCMAPLMNWLFQEFNLQGSFLILSGLMMHTIPAAALLRPLEHTKIDENLLQISKHGTDESDEVCQRIANQEGSEANEQAIESSGNSFISLKRETGGNTEHSLQPTSDLGSYGQHKHPSGANHITDPRKIQQCSDSNMGHCEAKRCSEEEQEQAMLLQDSIRASAKIDSETKISTSPENGSPTLREGNITSSSWDPTEQSIGTNQTGKVASGPASLGNCLRCYLKGAVLGKVMLNGRFRLFCLFICAFMFNHMGSSVFISSLAIERGCTIDQCALTIAITAGLEIPVRLSSGFCFDLKSVRYRRPVFLGLCACIAGSLGATLPLYPGKLSVLVTWAVQQCIGGR